VHDQGTVTKKGRGVDRGWKRATSLGLVTRSCGLERVGEMTMGRRLRNIPFRCVGHVKQDLSQHLFPGVHSVEIFSRDIIAEVSMGITQS
jgi:hypothetical protein